MASKYFLGEKTTFEKWIYVRPFQTQIENFGIQTDLLKNELNNGKIFVKIELQESLEEYKTKFLLYQKDSLIKARVCYSSSRLKTAINASCGTSTRPIAFIRFLPRFCFSSNLRLRVISPP